MKFKNINLQVELKDVIQQQIKLINDKHQKVKLLTKLRKITENLLKEYPNSIKFQKELKDVIQQQIDLTDDEYKKIELLIKSQKIIENLLKNNSNDVALQNELADIVQEQLSIINDKEKRYELLEIFQKIADLQPENIKLQNRLIDLIHEQIRLMKIPDNKLLNELKNRVNKIELNRTELKGNTLNLSIANFHILLQSCPPNEDNYEHMISLLEILSKKECPENVIITLTKCLQLHFLEIRIKNEENYYKCFKKLLNLITEYVQKDSNQIIEFIEFTFKYVAEKNDVKNIMGKTNDN